MARQRAHPGAVGAEVLDERELDGEVLLGPPPRTTAVAVDDGDRRAPVALAGDAPDVQAVLDLGLAEPLPGEPLDDALRAVAAGEPVEPARVHQHPLLRHDGEGLALEPHDLD